MAFNANCGYPGANGYNNVANQVPNYTATTVFNPISTMNPEAMFKMFQEYKESCRIRINSCGDNDKLKITSLESMVTELLEQNELLLNSLIELNQSKDSLINSSSSFSSSYSASSAASFDFPGYLVNNPTPNNVQYNQYGGQYQQIPSGQCPGQNIKSNAKNNSSAKNQMQKMPMHPKECPKQEKCNQTSDSMTDFKTISELKINYEQIKNDNLTIISERDNLRESNTRLINTNKQLEEDVNDLRHENDNLRHDMSNLIQIINQRDGENLEKGQDNCAKEINDHLTFCDSISPEDVYGPIESLRDLELSDSEFDHKQPTANRNKIGPQDRTSTVVTDAKRPSVSLNCSPSHKPSKLIATNSQLMMLMEEKESLINRLQQHLEEVTKQLNIRDEVIKKIEDKLIFKRKECSEWIERSTDLEMKLNDSTKKYLDLKSRELVLIEDKRELMAKLNQESDSCIEMKENFLVIKKQLQEVIKQNQYQNMTIEHLKEALVSTKNSCSNLHTPTFNVPMHQGSTNSMSVTSASNTAFGINYGPNYDHHKTVVNKSTPHLPSNNSGSRTSFKLDHV